MVMFRVQYDIVTFQYDIVTFQYNIITFQYDIVTFQYDIVTFQYDIVTFQYDIVTFQYDIVMFHNVSIWYGILQSKTEHLLYARIFFKIEGKRYRTLEIFHFKD
jgi:hypothetical protein